MMENVCYFVSWSINETKIESLRLMGDNCKIENDLIKENQEAIEMDGEFIQN